MKNYKIKKSKQLIEKLKPYWEEFKNWETYYYDTLQSLEEKMETETGIEGIEFFFADNFCVGIGTINRDMGLIHREELSDD